MHTSQNECSLRENSFCLVNTEVGWNTNGLCDMDGWWAVIPKTESGATSIQNESNLEDTWDSKKWLQKYGLKAQKLSFYDVLAECSFHHADGVVDIKTKPENESMQTSAVSDEHHAGLWPSLSARVGEAFLRPEPRAGPRLKAVWRKLNGVFT